MHLSLPNKIFSCVMTDAKGQRVYPQDVVIEILREHYGVDVSDIIDKKERENETNRRDHRVWKKQ